jgi:hypothetical protein
MADDDIEVATYVAVIDPQRVMVGAEARRGRGRLPLLRVGAIVDDDRVGVEVGITRRTRRRDHRRRIDAAGQEDADRDVGHQVGAHRVRHRLPGPRAERAIGDGFARRVGPRDVGELAAGDPTVRLPDTPRTRLERMDAAQPRERPGNAAPGDVREHPRRRHVTSGQPRPPQRADLRRHRHRVAVGGDVERLHAEPVAGDEQGARVRVP